MRDSDCLQVFSKMKVLANKLCVLKLNGGLGTTMGCTGPKSVVFAENLICVCDLSGWIGLNGDAS